MIVSAKTEYACIAVLELATRHDSGEPVRIREIADAHGIPSRFLVQILQQLKGAGYVQSIRGASGGYRLALAPEEISVWDVVQLVHGAATSGTNDDGTRAGGGWHIFKEVWESVNRSEEAKLREIDFARLVNQVTRQDAHMFHI